MSEQRTEEMKSIPLLLLVILGLGLADYGEGKSLLENLMHQAKTLQHGLELANTVGDIGSTHGRSIAFMAYQKTSKSYSSNSKVTFDAVRVNTDNAFNTGSYRFTAPSKGLYVFSWTIRSYSGYNIITSLMINHSQYQQSSCTGGSTSSSYRIFYQCSQTAIALLSKNDYAWIRVDTSSTTFYGPHTNFSGWKI